jgi:hypothetical protein
MKGWIPASSGVWGLKFLADGNFRQNGMGEGWDVPRSPIHSPLPRGVHSPNWHSH